MASLPTTSRTKRPWMLGDAQSDIASGLQSLSSAVGTGTGALAAERSGGASGLLNFLTGAAQPTAAQQVQAAVQSSWTKYVLIAAALGGAWWYWSKRKKRA